MQVLMRVPVPWVFVLAYLTGAGLTYLFPISLTPPRLLGVVLLALGAGIAAWCLILFRKSETTTTPGETSRALITRGPYRFTRNPMYVGLTLAYLGEMGILGQVWPLLPLALTLGYLNAVVIPVEELRLRERFGAEYDRYAARVRRWL